MRPLLPAADDRETVQASFAAPVTELLAQVIPLSAPGVSPVPLSVIGDVPVETFVDRAIEPVEGPDAVGSKLTVRFAL